MSDRTPKVTVDETFNSKWTATCHEPNCTWQHAPDEKTYVTERAKMHRAKHRADASTKCGATTAVHVGNQTPMDVHCWRLASHDGPCCGQTLDSDDNPIRYEWPRAVAR